MNKRPADDDQVPQETADFDRLANEQIKNYEPDQLDGPAWDLDRRLDGEESAGDS